MRDIKRKIVVFFSAVFLLVSMGSASFADGHGKKILFSIKGPGSGNPFWASVTKGAEEEAKKLGVKLILIAPPQEGDVQAQINQVEDQLAKGVDALALAPGGSFIWPYTNAAFEPSPSGFITPDSIIS